MTTIDLTADTFEQTITDDMALREGVLVFSRPGALNAAGLEQVNSGVQDLDMDDIRAQLAARWPA